MNVINMIFGADSHPAVKFSVIFLIVAVSLFILWFVVTKIFKSIKKGGFSSRSRQPRLGIIEDIDVDSERRLLLIRRDNVEHLLMVGGKNDFVVEQNITRAISVQVQPQPLPIQPEALEEAMPSNNFRVAAKAQARAAAQVSIAPVIKEVTIQEPLIQERIVQEPLIQERIAQERIAQEPVVIIKQNYAEVVTNAFKSPPRSESNPFSTIKPTAVEPAKPVIAAPVKPQTTFDSLEDEMAILLGQIKK